MLSKTPSTEELGLQLLSYVFSRPLGTVLNGFYQFRFHRYTSGFITILLLQDSKYSIWNTYYLEYLLFGMVAIWNTLILYWFHHVTMVSLITYILQIQHCT